MSRGGRPPRLPDRTLAAAAQALREDRQLRLVRRGLPVAGGRRPAARLIGRIAVGGVAALVMAAAAARLVAPEDEIGVRATPPHLTYSGMNDLAPLRDRLSPSGVPMGEPAADGAT